MYLYIKISRILLIPYKHVVLSGHSANILVIFAKMLTYCDVGQHSGSQRPWNRFQWAAARLRLKQTRETRFRSSQQVLESLNEFFQLRSDQILSHQARSQPELDLGSGFPGGFELEIWLEKCCSNFSKLLEKLGNVSPTSVLIERVLRLTRNGLMVAKIEHFNLGYKM